VAISGLRIVSLRLHGRVMKHSWLLAVAAVLLIALHGLLFDALAKMTLPDTFRPCHAMPGFCGE